MKKSSIALASVFLVLPLGAPTSEAQQPQAVYSPAAEQQQPQAMVPAAGSPAPYTVGVGDVLQIDVLQPDVINVTAAVSPDGSISFPFLGTLFVKGKNLNQIEEEIQSALADGYLNYPIVSVSLTESNSRKFFVYGEVNQPGSYPLVENTTVLRAVSVAGGFSKFGSKSRVKVLRAREEGPGYDLHKVDIGAVMEGNAQEDFVLASGDIVVVSEGIF